jgi:hypothetical protein
MGGMEAGDAGGRRASKVRAAGGWTHAHRYRHSKYHARHQRADVAGVGAARGGAGLLHAGDHRPDHVPQLRLADHADGSRGRDKSAASLDQISGGRFILGLGVGGREDDYEAVGVDFHQRGRIFDAQLEALQVAWSGAPQGANGKASTPRPTHDGGVPILIGGSTDAAIARAVK